MNPPPETPWERLVHARHASLPVTPEECPPPGFTTRVVARWAEMKQNEQARLWSRWSWRAALGGVLAAALMSLFTQPRAEASPLQVPEIELPSFTTP